MRTMPPNHRQGGNVLIFAVLLTIIMGGLIGALLTSIFNYHRSATEGLSRQLALQAAESGEAYYLLQVIASPTYLDTHAAPQAVQTLGDSTFQLQGIQKLSANLWQLLLQGNSGGVDCSLNAVIGSGRTPFPNGVVAVGTGDPAAVVVTINGGSKIGSFDPAKGPYDPAVPGTSAAIAANGSMAISGSSSVYGDVTAQGTVSVASGSTVAGATNAHSAALPIDSIDPVVNSAMTASQATNDNANLASVFGSQWTPLGGPENYGDLIINTPGTYVIPSGTYRFRRLEVHNGATVTFSTASAPSKLIYVGAGKGTGTLNDLLLDGGSKLQIDSGSTTNGLLTVLGTDCDFNVSGASAFGQNTSDASNSGYSQIISLGGNTTADTITVSDASTVFGRLYAAAHAMTMSSGSTWYGSALARTVNVGGSAPSTFGVDLGSLGNSIANPGTYAILASWPATP